MPLVLDASVAAAWFFPNEGEDATATEAAFRLIDGDGEG